MGSCIGWYYVLTMNMILVTHIYESYKFTSSILGLLFSVYVRVRITHKAPATVESFFPTAIPGGDRAY